MSQSPPIYETPTRRYLVDTCRPQRLALEQGKIEMHALTQGHYPGEQLARGSLPNVSGMGYWDAVVPQDWGLEPHRNEGIEVVLLETGHMPFNVDGHEYQLRPGDLTITLPWQLHCLGDPHIRPGRLHWFIIDVGVRRPNQNWRWPSWLPLTSEDLNELSARLGNNRKPLWRANAEVRHAFANIGRAIRVKSTPQRLSRIQINLGLILIEVLSMLQSHDEPSVSGAPHPSPVEHTVALFLEDLRTNETALNQQWSVEAMAAACGLGVTSFSQHCRRLVNASPARYLTCCRLDLAARLLTNERNLSVTNVAFRTGFSSSQYFASEFRRSFKCTPTTYRRRHCA